MLQVGAAAAAILAAQGLYPTGTTPAEFTLQSEREITKMKQVAACAKIQLD